MSSLGVSSRLSKAISADVLRLYVKQLIFQRKNSRRNFRHGLQEPLVETGRFRFEHVDKLHFAVSGSGFLL